MRVPRGKMLEGGEKRESRGLRRYVIIGTIALALLNACKNDNKNLLSLPPDGTFSNIMELPINKTDSEEIENYALFLDSYKGAKKNLDLLEKNEKLKDFIGEFISYDGMLPLFIKESRFISDIKSRTGAIGYGQLQSGAIQDISKWLKEYGVKERYNPNTNPSDNVLYSVLYMSYLKHKVKTYLEYQNIQTDEEDVFLFAISAYNLGITKWKTLHQASGKVKTRDEFAKYLLRDLMALKNKGKKEVDPSYGVEYINYFGDKDYTGNNDIIFKHQGDYFHTLTKSKAQETIRYIEVIRGLQEQLSKDQSDYDQIKIENNMLYKSISDWITKKETQNILKQCPVKDTLIKKILLDNGYTMKGAGGDSVEKITINKSIIEPYLIHKSFRKYTYTVETYNKTEKRYLWSIVDELIKNPKFIVSLKELNIDPKKDNISEEYNVIRQYAMEAITRFNQERRINRKETGSNDVWIPEKKYFENYGTLKNIETKLREYQEKVQRVLEKTTEKEIQTLKTGSLYANPSLDAKGNSIKKGPTEFAVTQVYNPTLALSEKNEEYPTHIFLHGTEVEREPNDISRIKAHFYIRKTGEIIQYITGANKNGNIIYPEKIIALNHAGFGNNQYGLSWEEDRMMTYKAIGIEIALTPTERPNSTQIASLDELLAGLSTSYKIPQKNILTHRQVATSSKYGRGRKSDPFGLDFEKIGLINNYERLDKDVISGKVSPNMKAQVDILKARGMQSAEIKKVLSGLNTSILLCRQNKEARNNRMNKGDFNAWATLSELEAKRFL